MPTLPPSVPVSHRSAEDTHLARQHNAKIIGTMIGVIVIILLIGGWIYGKGWAWYRSLQDAKAAKKKALSDQRAWYKSTRPVYRQPNTPHLLDVHSKALMAVAPSNENELCAGVSPDAITFREATIPPATGPSATFEPEPALGLETSDFNTCRHSSSLRDSCTTTATVSTVLSIGVAVPISLPASRSPIEVYYSRSVASHSADQDCVGIAVLMRLPAVISPKQVHVGAKSDGGIDNDTFFVVSDDVQI